MKSRTAAHIIALVLGALLAVGTGPVPAQATDRASRSALQWEEVIEAGGSRGYACRVELANGRFKIRARYVVADDAEEPVRFTVRRRANGVRERIDITEWLEPSDRGLLTTASYPRSARNVDGVWRIRIVQEGVGWLSYGYGRANIRRC